jgi:ribosomal protein L44E
MGVNMLERSPVMTGRFLLQHTCRDCNVEILRIWTTQCVDLRLQCESCAKRDSRIPMSSYGRL